VPRSSPSSDAALPADYAAARGGLAHRGRTGAIAVEGPDREAFLQGQLTQDVRGLAPGQSRLAAGLTAKGKILYFGRLVSEADRFLLLLPADAVAPAAAHLAKYAAFQKVTVRDATADVVRIALYGPRAAALAPPPLAVRLPAEWELAGELLAPASAAAELVAWLEASGSVPLSADSAEALRIEAGRPRLGRDADDTHLADEAGLSAAIAANKGCYVGQEIVARMRTYGRANRRLAGFRFPAGLLAPATAFADPEKPSLELARVTSSTVSPRLGPIGLGYAFRGLPDGASLPAGGPASAIVAGLPFA
jgi:folate-binding protein YgfZ